MTEWLSIAAAAARIGVSIPTIRRAIAAGELPAYRIATRVVRLRAADIDTWASRTPYAQEQV